MINIDEYIREKSIEVYSVIKNCKVIYLDTNFWIELSEENNKQEKEKRLFLDKICELVESGKCVCPISEITFWEIMKQSDVRTRNETVEMVDKFSKGVSIINTDQRLKIEVRNWFDNKINKKAQNIDELVWSKLSFVLGYTILNLVTIPSLQKGFLDYISNVSLLELVIANNKVVNHKSNTDEINTHILLYENQNKTFDDLFLSELFDIIDLQKGEIRQAINGILNEGTTPIHFQKDILSSDGNGFVNYIFKLFQEKKLNKDLPAFHITALLFTLVRWNKGRKLKKNDTMDFFHATFALPYCDYFFTDKSLRNIINQGKLDSMYNCVVEHNLDEVIKILYAI